MPSTSEFLAVGVVAAAVAAGLTIAQPKTPEPPPAKALPQGYLGERAPDAIAILPPAPQPGSAAYEADRRVFLATRALKGTPRWALAVNDVAQSPASMMKDFSCSLSVTLTPTNAPKLNHLMSQASADVGRVVNRPKDFYRRQRPYLVDEGETCVDKTEGLAKSPDYPSGHATWGWTWGLVLAELAPDRSSQVLARGRAYGESRTVCGVHNASAVDAARTNASALFAALHGERAFRRDMEEARTELRRLRTAPGPAPADCPAEAALIAKTPW